jgi:drug/metabolite transporter (DMT)-like permease
MGRFAALLLGIVANFIWGLAFLIPYALSAVDPVLITVGRYGCYGVLSLTLLATGPRAAIRKLGLGGWLWALGLALAGNIGYYILLVTSIRLGGVQVAALIVGSLPVTLAIYGNWSEREFSPRRLAAPLLMILAGLLAMNGWKFAAATSLSEGRTLAIGVACALCALVLWTWYGVKNAQYLKYHQWVSGRDWSNVVGASTLGLMVVGLPLATAVGIWSPAAALAPLSRGERLVPFLVASAVLGVVVSWFATVLWNAATRVLPVSLAGQLVVFETLSSIFYACLVDRAAPRPFEIGCIAFIVLGVFLGVGICVRPRPSLPAIPIMETHVEWTALPCAFLAIDTAIIPILENMDHSRVSEDRGPVLDRRVELSTSDASINSYRRVSRAIGLADETTASRQAERFPGVSVRIRFASEIKAATYCRGEGRASLDSATVTIAGDGEPNLEIRVRSNANGLTAEVALEYAGLTALAVRQEETAARDCPHSASTPGPCLAASDPSVTTVWDTIEAGTIAAGPAMTRTVSTG